MITPLGSTVNGAHSWIMLGGGFAFQPSEFAKLGLVMMLAMLLAQPAADTDRPRGMDVGIALVVAAFTMGLVMLQPDLGTTMVLGVITAGAIVVAGVRKRWIGGLTLLVVGAGGGRVVPRRAGAVPDRPVHRLPQPGQRSARVGYNSTQSLIAIGSGELFGKGLFDGGQTTGRFVPEQHTDFIFTVAGEEFGFLGSVTVVALLGVILLRAGGSRASATTGSARWWPGRSCAGWPSSLRQHRDDGRDHADHRSPPAVRLLWRYRDLRQYDRLRPAPGHPHRRQSFQYAGSSPVRPCSGPVPART